MNTKVNLTVENGNQKSQITYLKDLKPLVPFRAIAGYKESECVGIRVRDEVLYFRNYVTDQDELTADVSPNVPYKNVRYFNNIDVRIY